MNLEKPSPLFALRNAFSPIGVADFDVLDDIVYILPH